MSRAHAAPVGAVRRSLRALSLPGVAIAMVVLGGCAAPRPAAGPPAKSARQQVAEGALLLDVRTPEEFADGHLDGAINIPVGALSSRLGELDRKRPVVVYCRSGNRSATAAATLRDAGFTEVLDLGPMSAW